MGTESFIKRLESGLGEWVIKHRWWVMLVSILTVVVAGSGIQFLTFNRDLRVFFGEDNPQLQAFEALENTYTRSDNVLFVLAPEDGNVFTRETLAAIKELTERLWHTPYSSRVDSLTNFQHIRVEGDDLFVEDLVIAVDSLSEADLERIREIAVNEPGLVNFLVSASGHVAGVSVTVLLPEESNAAVVKVTDFARDVADVLRRMHPHLTIYLTGDVMFDDAYGRVSKDDMSTLLPVMFLVLLFITALALRSIAGMLGALLVIVTSVVTGMGLAGWIGISLNPAAANAPTIILTVAIADSIHILATMFQQLRGGRSRYAAIAESLRLNLYAVLLTSVTTAIGFLTLNVSESPPFRDLGNIVAMGVIAGLVYSVLLLPAVIAVLPMHVRPSAAGARPSCDRLADFVIRRHAAVFWSTLAVATLLAAGTLRIELGDDWIKYFDKGYDFRIAADFTSENLTGMQIIEYSLESGESGGINTPEYLATIDTFANWYRQQPTVVHVRTIADTLKRLNRAMHGGDETLYRLPEQRELAAQYLLLYELSLPFGLDLNHRINIDMSATRMTVLLRDITTKELRAMDATAEQWLKANAPAGFVTSGTGPSIIWAYLSERNILAMIGGSFGALVLISGLLLFALRSVKLGLVSLVPNLAPAFVAFGVWGWAVGQMGLGLSVVVSLTLGIIVDDTVHFLSKYLRGRREEGKDPAEAVRYAFNTVGTALWVTSVVLITGFLVLTFSSYRMNADMGLMAAITIGLALILDFLLLPALLIKVEKGSMKPVRTR